jgi:hypothetical protein
MKELTILQLKCEFLYEEVGANKNLFTGTGQLEKLQSKLETLEKYLNGLVGEYEDCHLLYPDKYYIEDIPFMPLDKLENLKEYISKDAHRFKCNFKEPSDTVIKVLLGILDSPIL